MRTAPRLLIAALAVLAMGLGGLFTWAAITVSETPSSTNGAGRDDGNEGASAEARATSLEYVAFEYSWREQTTTKQAVTRPYVCDGVIYCENPFPTVEWVTVPGPVVTKTDVVCATSFDEARSMVSAEATVTGVELDPTLCTVPEDEPVEDVDESEVVESEVAAPEVEPEAIESDVDEEAAIQEYLDEGEMYDQDLLTGYSEPLGVGLPNEERTDVRQVQLWLRQQGFRPGTADGYYGASTAEAVRWFQRYVGLSVDGVVGKDTWSSLNEGLGY